MFRKEISQTGLTLIEVLVTILILATISLGLYSLYSYTLKIISENRARTGAVALTEQKLEMARNLPYNNVGTIGGIPPGTIPGRENIIKNNINYTVDSFVWYIDDSYDGLLGDHQETLNTDYKKIEVRTSWTSPFGRRSVNLSTIIAPKGIETTGGGGTLKINVFNASGLPVGAANIHLENDQVEPEISADYQTNDQGVLLLPGAPESLESYNVTVSRDGYSVDQTCPQETGVPNPICPVAIENLNPTKPYLSVQEGELTEAGFAIDFVSGLNIFTIHKGVADNWQISDEVMGENQTAAALSLDNSQHLYFVWQDYRQGSAAKLYGQKYNTSKTKFWAEDVRVSTPNNQVYPEIINDPSGNLYVVWNDDRGGNQDAYIMKYKTNGETAWTGDKKINTDAQNEDQIQPAIDFNAGYAYVTWADHRDDQYDIYAQKIDPEGNYQWTPEIRLTSEEDEQYNPAISVENEGNAYIVWTDEQNDAGDIYAQKIDPDGNKLWPADLKINSDAGEHHQDQARTALDSEENLHVAWSDDRNGDYDIYAQKIDPEGNKLWTNDLKVNTDATTRIQTTPDIAIDTEDNLFYIWTDARNGNNDIFAQQYDPELIKIWADDIRINTDLGSADQKNPKIATYGVGNIVVVWEDNRNGAYTIYAATYSGPGSITSVNHVPLHIYGSKRIGEDPVILKYDQEVQTDNNGILNLTNLEWDSYYIEPVTGSGYTLLESDPVQPIALEPNTNRDVVLTLE